MQNTAFLEKDAHYYVRFKHWMLPFIADGDNVIMDLGCASGIMGRKLLESGKASEVYGVEIFEEAASEAGSIYRKVHVGDIEEMHLEYNQDFDYIICGDILEHLKNPYEVMSRVFTWLKPGGKVLICLPNVRHYSVLTELIFKGQWKYADAGIMDKTHLRFFTRRSTMQMVEDAGFKVFHSSMVVEGPKKNFFNKLTFGLFDEFLASQSFCCAQKSKN